ncbi:MAG: DUF5312 family protein, partial [Spirochaetaceae bacterium]|nr:DUF5312 family protein [Spirochaetaceae bacterium]
MGILDAIKAFIEKLLARDPETMRRRSDLRRLHSQLAALKPPYYRPKQNLVLPGFATELYSFCVALRPLAELARATVAHPDARVALLFLDHLIDSQRPIEDQERKASFTYESLNERIERSVDPREEIDRFVDEFQDFLVSIDELGKKSINADLYEVERFTDLCRHDYERILGLFDPGISVENIRQKPDFSPVAGEKLGPELIDFYYQIEGFFFSPKLKEGVVRLLDRRQPGGANEGKKAKIDKLFSQLDQLLSGELNPELILAMIRALRGDPYFTPSTPRERKDYIDAYKHRIVAQFEKDKDRILRELHENTVAADIRTLFGDSEILEVEYYDEEGDAFLRRESATAFTHVKPMRILKTFILGVFEPTLRDPVKRVLVEGYFGNKGFQNNLANIFYQCERAGAKIAEFEEQLGGKGRVSLVAVKRYVDEMRRGKDISSFLGRIVDAINGRAHEIVSDQTGIFSLLGEAVGELLADFRKTSPDL